MKNTAHHSITVHGKKYEYQFSTNTKEKTTHVTCPAAKIDQEFLNEDISALLLDLPNLILAEKEYQQKQNEVIRFRVTSMEKEVIEKNAVKHGFRSISSFLRERGLAK